MSPFGVSLFIGFEFTFAYINTSFSIYIYIFLSEYYALIVFGSKYSNVPGSTPLSTLYYLHDYCTTLIK